MKRIILACIILLNTLVLPATSFAIDMPEKAAMVIRFDRTVPVTYERSLQKVVQASKQLKPETFFDIISVVPQTGNTSADAATTNWATENAAKITQQIMSYGISQDRIRVAYQPDKSTALNEVHIFVR